MHVQQNMIQLHVTLYFFVIPSRGGTDFPSLKTTKRQLFIVSQNSERGVVREFKVSEVLTNISLIKIIDLLQFLI